MSDFNELDSNGTGTVSGGSDWATHVHKSNDPLDPWYSIRDEKTGETWKGRSDKNEYIDSLLPAWMKE